MTDAVVSLKAPDLPPDGAQDPAFWHSLIDEKEAGSFLNLSERTMQLWRQRGGGPKFIRISARCVRYRRADLRTWADQKLRVSTADRGEAA